MFGLFWVRGVRLIAFGVRIAVATRPVADCQRLAKRYDVGTRKLAWQITAALMHLLHEVAGEARRVAEAVGTRQTLVAHDEGLPRPVALRDPLGWHLALAAHERRVAFE